MTTEKEPHYVVSPLASLRWIEDTVVITSPVSKRVICFSPEESFDFFSLMTVFAAPHTVSIAARKLRKKKIEVDDETLNGLVKRLLSLGIIEPFQSAEEQAKQAWGWLGAQKGWNDLHCQQITQIDHAFSKSNKNGPCDEAGKPIPWFSTSAVDCLKEIDFSQKSVFEWGAGNSTLWWGSVAKTVVSIENNEFWYKSLQKRIPSNVRLLFRRGKDFIHAIHESSETFDVIVIDGAGHRFDCACEALKKLNRGGLIVLDDTQAHFASARQLRAADLIQVDIRGLAPCQDYAQTTSLFFHRDFAFDSAFPERPRRARDEQCPWDFPNDHKPEPLIG